MWRLTKGATELAAEVRLREPRGTGELGDVERLAVARIDLVFRAQQVPRWMRGDHFTTRCIVSSCVVRYDTKTPRRDASHRP